MTKLISPGTTTRTVKRSPLRGSAKNFIPRKLIAHQVAGHLALDFCNTAGEHRAERPDELWRDWESFLRWAAQAGVIGPESYFELLRYPEPLAEIIRFRETIYRVGLAIADARPISAHDIEFIRERVNAPRPAIEFHNHAIRWHPARLHASAQLCAVFTGEALSLFCSPMAERIGVCEGGNCGWLFLDQSRGKRRRWCDMNDCGNREKARRYYEKQKGL